ncbi:MAG: phosphoribosylformylglycinamidine synthase [Planctomycetota bacterium]|nr:MAG: phosphoribosylformylglycinamidine synthase [Planctomycetota bacterium]
MSSAKVLQLFAAGVNCDRELRFAWEQAGAEVEECHIRELMAKPAKVLECDLFSIPGGFTYGDDLGAGRVLGLEVAAFLGEQLRALHQAGGSLFGVCNGFQALVRTGLLPDLEGVSVSLAWNVHHRFECRWSRLRVEAGLAQVLPEGSLLPACTAHAEGQLVVASPEDLIRLEQNRRIAFRYADAAGEVSESYPDCPNGSAGGIAGLVSASGRILGLMPHPERNLGPFSLPDGGAGAWGTGEEGMAFFRALLAPYLGSVQV